MSVQAKFFVQKVDRFDGAATASNIEFSAVCRGIENAGWAAATPGGRIQLGVLNDKATDYFEQGAEYIVTFVRVEKPAPGDGHPIAPVTDKYNNLLCATCGGHVGGETGAEMHEQVYGKKA